MRWPFERHAAPTVLCIGAHSDDIEIGAGGTILRLVREVPGCRFHWAVFAAHGARAQEAGSAASALVGDALQPPLMHAFPDGFFPYEAREVKHAFEALKESVSPSLVLTHQRGDAHQDHRLIAELTWNTFRDHMILEYEIPKYDGDVGQPSFFVPLTLQDCERKVSTLMDSFPSQHDKAWFKPELFMALMRLRGMECNSPSGYAEAFYCRKVVV
jgi:LmbE family N-acetylglucosaminyl deacetylase